ncbi:MAG: YceI family protein [Cyclobacteriaceae bacterium]|nr:YceI family protein [Cyclobacteriaceae bacterium]
MNRHKRHTGVSLFIVSILFCHQALSQNSFRQVAGTSIVVSGTSTLHDWTLTSTEVKINATLQLTEGSVLIGLESLSVVIPTKSLKSGHVAMDRNTYSTIDAERYPTIEFKMLSATVSNSVIHCLGQLTVAGATKKINLDTAFKIDTKQNLSCTGSIKLKMSDFNIEPPSFMFGTVTTGNEITISFQANLAGG